MPAPLCAVQDAGELSDLGEVRVGGVRLHDAGEIDEPIHYHPHRS